VTFTRIHGGRIIDPAHQVDRIDDLWIQDRRILGVGPRPPGAPERADVELDATGLIVCPGLIDVHVHLREPGDEASETIASGAASALAGGVTTIAAMPNTTPPIDSQGAAEFVVLQGRRAARAHVLPVGAVSKGREGRELAELGRLVEGGAVAFTDDGSPVSSAELMRRALEYANLFDLAIMQHCQVMELTEGAVMNEGFESARLGLRGMPPAAEDIMVARDIRLAEITGGRLHIQHISTARAVELVREGKRRGVRVTAEACPHHFTLTDEKLRTFDTVYKMNPPLRTAEDVEAVIEGLIDGTIDLLATDHAPHSQEKKSQAIDVAPFGVIGLETLLPVSATALVKTERLTWPQLLGKLTEQPARLLNLTDKGHFGVGADADVTLFDPETVWTIDVNTFQSRSRNCPFHGWEVIGRVETVLVEGAIRYQRPTT